MESMAPCVAVDISDFSSLIAALISGGLAPPFPRSCCQWWRESLAPVLPNPYELLHATIAGAASKSGQPGLYPCLRHPAGGVSTPGQGTTRKVRYQWQSFMHD